VQVNAIFDQLGFKSDMEIFGNPSENERYRVVERPLGLLSFKNSDTERGYAFKNIIENKQADIIMLILYSILGIILVSMVLSNVGVKAWVYVLQTFLCLALAVGIYFLRIYLSRTSYFLFQAFDVFLQIVTVLCIIAVGPLGHKAISEDMQNILFHHILLLAYYTKAIEFRPYCFKISVVSIGRLISRVLTFKHDVPVIVLVLN